MWDGWGVDNLNTRFQPAMAAGVTAAQVPALKLKWAFGFPGARSAYSQPNVVGGRVYTGSNDGTVYAIDARSGCLYWMFRAKSMVRSSVVVGPDKRAYIGDLEREPVRARYGNRQADLAEKGRRPTVHAHHSHPQVV